MTTKPLSTTICNVAEESDLDDYHVAEGSDCGDSGGVSESELSLVCNGDAGHHSTRGPACHHCNACDVWLYACAGCVGRLSRWYCGKSCQVSDWKLGHKRECQPMSCVATSDGQNRQDAGRARGERALRLTASIHALARQRQGLIAGRASGFMPRDSTEAKQEKVHYTRLPKVNLWAGHFDGGHKVNYERGIACQGQGKRHNNPPARAQPKLGGSRQAKWSNPNPAHSGAATQGSAAKSKKNFKQRL